MKRLIVMFAALTLAGCVVGDQEAQETLQKAGFSQISVGGAALFGCDEKELMGREFTARNPMGQSVDGVVCCGLLKRCTIRF